MDGIISSITIDKVIASAAIYNVVSAITLIRSVITENDIGTIIAIDTVIACSQTIE